MVAEVAPGYERVKEVFLRNFEPTGDGQEDLGASVSKDNEQRPRQLFINS